MLPPLAGHLGCRMHFLHALGETLAIALLGTLGGRRAGLPGRLPGGQATSSPTASRISRRGASLDTIRGVDVLIWALIWINVVGLGPFAGILAIAASDFGTFGKLFSEAIETADQQAGRGRAVDRRLQPARRPLRRCCRRSCR